MPEHPTAHDAREDMLTMLGVLEARDAGDNAAANTLLAGLSTDQAMTALSNLCRTLILTPAVPSKQAYDGIRQGVISAQINADRPQAAD